MDKKRLECKICGFRSDDLVDHIESKHAKEAKGEDALAWYMIKFKVDEDGVIFKESMATDGDSIRGVPVFKGSGGTHVPRHNPNYYFPKHAEDILADIHEDKRVMLVGHTGCGKTSIVEQIASRSNHGTSRVNLNGQTTAGDFLGLWTVRGGNTEYLYGKLPTAMRQGLWLILDEIDFGEPAILAELNPVLEPGGKLVLKENGNEIITPHADFRIFATANTVGCMSNQRHLYQGTNIMNEAFLDRFRCYHVDYLPPEEEVKVLMSYLPRLTKRLAESIVQVGGLSREAFKKEEISCTFSLRRMLDWTELMIRHQNVPAPLFAPHVAAEVAIYSKISREDKEVIRGIIQRVMIKG